jgi:hypothetical protein
MGNRAAARAAGSGRPTRSPRPPRTPDQKPIRSTCHTPSGRATIAGTPAAAPYNRVPPPARGRDEVCHPRAADDLGEPKPSPRTPHTPSTAAGCADREAVTVVMARPYGQTGSLLRSNFMPIEWAGLSPPGGRATWQSVLADRHCARRVVPRWSPPCRRRAPATRPETSPPRPSRAERTDIRTFVHRPSCSANVRTCLMLPGV